MAKEKLNLAEMSEADLRSQLGSLENELLTMRFEHATKGLGNPMQIRDVRRDIARIYTEARRRELASMSVEELETRSKLRARRRREK